jgi:hypothetical protein
MASTGSSSFSPALASSARAMSTRSFSTSERPISLPCALKKVKAMPPPMSSVSTFGSSDSITSILPEIFAPPMMATRGRLGSSTAGPRKSSSFFIRYPAARCGRLTPTMELWARCAAPKASLT